MFRIAVNGCCGRMGLTVGRLACRDKSVAVASALERADHEALGKDYGEILRQGRLGICVSAAMAAPADALIDFTAPEAVLARVPECVANRTAMVVGTTGLAEADVRKLRKAASKIPILVSSNMSFGVNLLFRIAGEIAGVLGAEFDAEIVETHHRMKKDAPSGTALALAKAISGARGSTVHGRSGAVGERPRGEIGVHAVRGGDVVGEHTLYFLGEGESFEVTHRARSREIFAAGAIRIGRILAAQKPGWYSFAELIRP